MWRSMTFCKELKLVWMLWTFRVWCLSQRLFSNYIGQKLGWPLLIHSTNTHLLWCWNNILVNFKLWFPRSRMWSDARHPCAWEISSSTRNSTKDYILLPVSWRGKPWMNLILKLVLSVKIGVISQPQMRMQSEEDLAPLVQIRFRATAEAADLPRYTTQWRIRKKNFLFNPFIPHFQKSTFSQKVKGKIIYMRVTENW